MVAGRRIGLTARGRVKLANDVTYKRCVSTSAISAECLSNLWMMGNLTLYRMNQTMERMQKMEEKGYTILTRILFGLESPTPVAEGDEEVEFIDETLNESQRDAVRFALASREVALVHGPPGVSILRSNHEATRLRGSRLERLIPLLRLYCNWCGARSVS